MSKKKNSELKSKIEAILYANPTGIELDRIAKLCGMGSKGIVKNVLLELQDHYDKRTAGIQICQKEDKSWCFNILDDHTELAADSARPEIDRAILQTLAFIAHQKGAKQSEVVKIRSNKAYGHIEQLKKLGFVETSKKGRTKFIKPTTKFYEYFSVTEEELDEQFEAQPE